MRDLEHSEGGDRGSDFDGQFASRLPLWDTEQANFFCNLGHKVDANVVQLSDALHGIKEMTNLSLCLMAKVDHIGECFNQLNGRFSAYVHGSSFGQSGQPEFGPAGVSPSHRSVYPGWGIRAYPGLAHMGPPSGDYRGSPFTIKEPSSVPGAAREYYLQQLETFLEEGPVHMHIGEPGFSSVHGMSSGDNQVDEQAPPANMAPSPSCTTYQTSSSEEDLDGQLGESVSNTFYTEPREVADIPNCEMSSKELPAQVEGSLSPQLAPTPAPQDTHMAQEEVYCKHVENAPINILVTETMAHPDGGMGYLHNEQSSAAPSIAGAPAPAYETRHDLKTVGVQEAPAKQEGQQSANTLAAEEEQGGTTAPGATMTGNTGFQQTAPAEQEGQEGVITPAAEKGQGSTTAPKAHMTGNIGIQQTVPLAVNSTLKVNFTPHNDSGADSPAAEATGEGYAAEEPVIIDVAHTQPGQPAVQQSQADSNAVEVHQASDVAAPPRSDSAVDLTLSPLACEQSGSVTPRLSRYGSAQLCSTAEESTAQPSDGATTGGSVQLAMGSSDGAVADMAASLESRDSGEDATNTSVAAKRRRHRGGKKKRGGRRGSNKGKDERPAADVDEMIADDSTAQPAAAADVQPVTGSAAGASYASIVAQGQGNRGNGANSGGGRGRGNGNGEGNGRSMAPASPSASSSAPPPGFGNSNPQPFMRQPGGIRGGRGQQNGAASQPRAARDIGGHAGGTNGPVRGRGGPARAPAPFRDAPPTGERRPARQSEYGSHDAGSQQRAARLWADATGGRGQPGGPFRGRAASAVASGGQARAAPQMPIGSAAARQSGGTRPRVGSGNSTQPAPSRSQGSAELGAARQPSGHRASGWYNRAASPEYGSFLEIARRAQNITTPR